MLLFAVLIGKNVNAESDRDISLIKAVVFMVKTQVLFYILRYMAEFAPPPHIQPRLHMI